ncbi:hypothetical protein D3C80_2026870 [compost metagenome]
MLPDAVALYIIPVDQPFLVKSEIAIFDFEFVPGLIAEDGTDFLLRRAVVAIADRCFVVVERGVNFLVREENLIFHIVF